MEAWWRPARRLRGSFSAFGPFSSTCTLSNDDDDDDGGQRDPENYSEQIDATVGSGRVLLVLAHTLGGARSPEILDRRGIRIDQKRFYGVEVALYDLR